MATIEVQTAATSTANTTYTISENDRTILDATLRDISPALTLSPLDQSMPRGWFRPLFFFPLSSETDPLEAVDILRQGLEPTKLAIPSITSEVIADGTAAQSGSVSLRSGDFGSLLVKDLRGKGFVYDKLREENFPASKLSSAVFCDTGVYPMPGESHPVFVPRVSIIDGGLVLTVSAHHTVFDAQGLIEVLRVWAQNCQHIQDKTIAGCKSLPTELFSKPSHYANQKPSTQKGQPEYHPEYKILDEPFRFHPPPPELVHISRVYQLTPKALAELKNDCTESGKPWISTNDAVNALIWRCVMRAQVDLNTLPDSAVSRNMLCVDGRTRADPPLSKHYPGCMMMFAWPGMDIRQLISSSDLTSIAQMVRKAVDSVDAAYIDSVVTLLDTVPGYDRWLYTSLPDLLGTALMVSSWYSLDVYDFNWGPKLGSIERTRFTSEGMFNGSTVILPRVTKAGQQEGMEISVSMDRKNFEKLDRDLLWSKYAVATDSRS